MKSVKTSVCRAHLAGAAALVLSLVAGPAHAVERAKAWVWANQPTAGSYVSDLAYQFNSTGAVNHVTREGKGRYLVDLPGLEAAAGGVVQVTAYGGSHHCKVLKWKPIGTALRVFVRCFVGAARADGQFTLLFYKESRASTVWRDAYLWSNRPKPAPPTYTPSLLYQWNSKGQVNTVKRLSKGVYSAKLSGTGGPGANAERGTVLVTAYGPSADRCKVEAWGPDGSDTLAKVRCFGPNGAKVDTKFTLSFMTDLALGVRVSEDADYGGYAWAHDPTSPFYLPSPIYSENNTGSQIAAGWLDTGSYRVRFGLLKPADKTTALVTAQGPESEFCTVAGWGADGDGNTIAYVRCFKSNRQPVDTRFTVLYLTDEQILF